MPGKGFQKIATDAFEFSRAVYRLMRRSRVNRPSLEPIAAVSSKEVHMQVRQRVPMNFVIHFDRPGQGGNDLRSQLRVAHERGGSHGREIMKVDRMNPRHEADISAYRCRFLHRHPGCLEPRHQIERLPATAYRTFGAGTQSRPPIRVIPCAHREYLASIAAPLSRAAPGQAGPLPCQDRVPLSTNSRPALPSPSSRVIS